MKFSAFPPIVIIKKLSECKRINLYVCAVIFFCSIYLTALAVFRRQFVNPLSKAVNNGTSSTTEFVDYNHSAMSMVILWIAAVVAGYIIHLLRLPSLLGVLICGILFRNIPFIADRIFIDDSLNGFLRKAAFTVILIRGGIGLDPDALKKTMEVIFRLGIISPSAEAVIITVLALVIFRMNLKMCFVFGMTLAATSPAVTIPTMLGLNKRGYGTSSGVPTVVLAAAAIDNMICLTFANIFMNLIFSTGSIYAELGIIVLQIVVGLIIGLIFGTLLWYFPQVNSHQLHFTRGSILQCLSLAFIFGGERINWYSAGVIATIITSIAASIAWKSDNDLKAKKESEAFALIWNLLGMQVMFALIGYKFVLSELTLFVVLKGIGILAVAVVVRAIFVFLLSLRSGFTRLEQTFMSLSFFPKATVQAALVPQIMEECMGTEYEDQARIVMQVCVFAILVTAPLGQLILQLYGPYALSSKHAYEVSGVNNDESETRNSSSTKATPL